MAPASGLGGPATNEKAPFVKHDGAFPGASRIECGGPLSGNLQLGLDISCRGLFVASWLAVLDEPAVLRPNFRPCANLPAQPGRWRLAPLLPQLVQRAPARSLSLDAPGPHRMTATAQASGA